MDEVATLSSRAAKRADARASTCSSCTSPTAICCRRFISPRREPAHRRIRRQPREPHALSRSRCSTRCARSWPDEKPISVRISATDWVATSGITGEDSVAHREDAQGPWLRPGRRLGRPDHARRQAGLWPHVPDAVRRAGAHEAGIPTIAVGNITTRRPGQHDRRRGPRRLVALARPHLPTRISRCDAAALYGFGARAGRYNTRRPRIRPSAWPSAPRPRPCRCARRPSRAATGGRRPKKVARRRSSAVGAIPSGVLSPSRATRGPLPCPRGRGWRAQRAG